MTKELKPCPFCGGEAKLEGPGDGWGEFYKVSCPPCVSQSFTASRDVVIGEWNKRVSDD
jgi:hypothetical protein